jgi:putative membrane-bound dehydrogenase-like protein
MKVIFPLKVNDSLLLLLFYLILYLVSGCNKRDSKILDASSEDIEFELQDFPINSDLYKYKDSVHIKEAMAQFQLEPGLRIELVAAEPLVIDPSAITFDEDGVMFVAENRGYPDPVDGGAPTNHGRIARLEDKDGDGRMDHRTEFVTGLTYPNGIMPWRGGVFVTCAPDIFYFKDTDGDGVADIKKKVLTGFNADKTAQIRTSHPTLGLDGWIYITSGLNGGEVKSPVHPERPPVIFTASDGRFHPETFEFETTGGRSQFGLAFDLYGRRFGSSNRHPMQQIVMEPRYLKRNPHLMFNETVQNVAKAEAEATVFPISNTVTSADFIPNLIGRSHKGTFTSACGLVIFNGTAIGPNHQGNVFICEPAQNLVQRQIVLEDGVSYRSELPYKNREFLSSTDSWFNPVFLTHGPQGALYLADMYRKVIDHPSYVPEEAREELDFESGKNKGRVYRIVNKNFKQLKDNTGNSLINTADLDKMVDALESPEEWERATAFRLLLEHKNKRTAPLLKVVAEEAYLPESRTRAFWLLHNLGAIEVSTIENVFDDEEAGLREQAIMVIEDVVEDHPELLKILVSGSKDDSPRVRLSSALVLGSLKDPQVIPALAQVAAQDGSDRWVRAAVLSGIGNRLPEFLKAFRHIRQADPLAFTAVMQDLGQLFGNGATIKEGQTLLKEIVQDDGELEWRMSAALGLMQGISSRSELNRSGEGIIFDLIGKNPPKADTYALEDFLLKVASKAADRNESPRLRIIATALMGYSNFERTGKVLQALLDTKNLPEIQLEAISALTRLGDSRGGSILTAEKAWSSYTPRIKSAVIEALVSKPVFINSMFAAIEEGIIAPAEISSMARQRLIKDKDPKISKQASILFNYLEGGGRMQVYEEYQEILSLSPDETLGKSVFQKTCSACHTYAGEGGKVGPDLTGVKNQPADALLLHTLVPNYEVLPAYQAVSIETSDGRSLSGWILAETDNSLTLRTAYGTEEPVLRSNIVAINNSGLSLMPDGLEQTMTKEDLANLIAYLKTGG